MAHILIMGFQDNCIWQKQLQADWPSENPRNWAGFCALTVPWRCWKSYLPCSKRSENTINQKNRQFYIEAMSQKISQLRKNIYFFSSSKKIWKNTFSEKKIKTSENFQNAQISTKMIMFKNFQISIMLNFNIIEIWTFSKMNIFVAIWAFWCFFRFFDFFSEKIFFHFFLNSKKIIRFFGVEIFFGT